MDGYLALRNIPNARLDEMRILLDWLDEADKGIRSRQRGAGCRRQQVRGSIPKLSGACRKHSCHGRDFLEPESDSGALAALFRPKDPGPCRHMVSLLTIKRHRRCRRQDLFSGLTNNPLSESFTRHLLHVCGKT